MTATTSSQSTAIAVPEPVFTHQEQLALAGFLAGYTGLTREAYALDLRQYAAWCQQRRHHQAGRAAHAATRVHHRRAGCRGAASRRAGSRLPRRSSHHDEV